MYSGPGRQEAGPPLRNAKRGVLGVFEAGSDKGPAIVAARGGRSSWQGSSGCAGAQATTRLGSRAVDFRHEERIRK